MNKFSRFVLNFGFFKSMLLVVMLSIGLSVFFVYFGTSNFFPGFFEDKAILHDTMVITVVVSAIVSFIASFGFISLLFRINKLEEEARYLATYDALTGLLSRRAFYEHAEKQLKISARNKNSIAILIADLDGFKDINDTYGHLAGDEVLKMMGKVITESVRESDIAGRVGGDEFIFCLPNANEETARNFGKRLLESVNGSSVTSNGNQIKFGMSVGVHVSEMGASVDLSLLIHEADKALYQAKRSGKNCIL